MGEGGRSSEGEQRFRRGLVFDVQRFSLENGPGIRTTIFMKGCPLHCRWCHNPESQRPAPEVLFFGRKCIGCGRCAAVCPEGCHFFSEGRHHYRGKECIGCGRCAVVCPVKANCLKGELRLAEELLDLAARDLPFYESTGGGLTISGGEPLMQRAFAEELLAGARRRGIHTCLDTSGCIRIEAPERLAGLTDLILFDIKSLHPEKYAAFTGGDLETVLENLRALERCGAEVILRCPVIPGCNDSREELEGIGVLAGRLASVREVHIIPYHDFWRHKLEELGRDTGSFSPALPAPGTLEGWIRTVRSCTTKPVRGI